jgi:hypothetical protein
VTGVWRTLRGLWAAQVELQERLLLLNRPWEEELLHWADGELHGSVVPPQDARRRSVTGAGWCPGGHPAARTTRPAV